MEPEKCSCGDVLEPSTARLADWAVEARRCGGCGEIELDPLQMELVLAHRGLTREGAVPTTVRGPSGSGKSSYLRIPPNVYGDLALDEEDQVFIRALQPGWVAVRLTEAAEGITPASTPRTQEAAPEEPQEASETTEARPWDDEELAE